MAWPWLGLGFALWLGLGLNVQQYRSIYIMASKRIKIQYVTKEVAVNPTALSNGNSTFTIDNDGNYTMSGNINSPVRPSNSGKSLLVATKNCPYEHKGIAYRINWNFSKV